MNKIENNFLFIGVGEQGIPISITEKLIEKYKIKNTYAVVNEEYKNPIFREAIYIWDAFVGKYPLMEEIPPIDRAYKNPIFQFSVEILHQISRNGNWDFEKRVNLYYSNLRYWDNFLETRKINCVIFSRIPHEVFDYIIYLLCKYKNIKTCMSYIDGYKESVTSRAYYMLDSIEKHTGELKSEFDRLKDEYKDLSENDIVLPEYTEQDIKRIRYRFEHAENSSNPLMSKGKIEEIKRYYGDPKQVLKDKKGKRNFKHFIKSFCKYRVGFYKTKRLIRKYESLAENPDFTDKYFFYALHYQPECTSSPLGGMYANQLLAIRLIANNLPEGYWLYVKEHPVQISFGRDESYYNELAKISNVKIISQKITSEELIKNAIAIATLTGTVMIESQIIQKPCFCFGYAPQEVLDGVYKIDTNEDFIKAVNEIIEGKMKVTTSKDLRLYLLAMEKICFSKTDEDEFYNKLLQYIG